MTESDEPGYEEARAELEKVVGRLEAGGLSLEDSLALWERGETLARLCERHLAGARERVEAVLQEADHEAGGDAEATPGRGTPATGA
ncbi:exodeoxyribonuclease VII small subunit [Actinomycetospora rhizophila]|uniref:Exodeoxyribonuclease 7 small subunit n=1 Tax=Actinomycetospora rhizophila TaxID=1416876 RepID=A0ABV9ZMT3_9PSEU